MRIGIDIDDTMTNSSELIAEYAKRYFKSDDINLINSILHAKKIDGELLDFYNKYLPEMMANYTLKENAKVVIDRLRTNGHKIIIITARGYTVQKGLVEITKEYFKNHNLVVDNMIFRTINKRDVCIENKLNIMVDDSISVCESLINTRIKPILFNSISNRKNETNFNNVSSWLELEKMIEDVSD